MRALKSTWWHASVASSVVELPGLVPAPVNTNMIKSAEPAPTEEGKGPAASVPVEALGSSVPSMKALTSSTTRVQLWVRAPISSAAMTDPLLLPCLDDQRGMALDWPLWHHIVTAWHTVSFIYYSLCSFLSREEAAAAMLWCCQGMGTRVIAWPGSHVLRDDGGEDRKDSRRTEACMIAWRRRVSFDGGPPAALLFGTRAATQLS